MTARGATPLVFLAIGIAALIPYALARGGVPAPGATFLAGAGGAFIGAAALLGAPRSRRLFARGGPVFFALGGFIFSFAMATFWPVAALSSGGFWLGTWFTYGIAVGLDPTFAAAANRASADRRAAVGAERTAGPLGQRGRINRPG